MMKLPSTSTVVNKDIDNVFEFLSNPKYLNVMSSIATGIKNARVEHLNSLPYGTGKQIRMLWRKDDNEFSMDSEIYKFNSPNEIGVKLINMRSLKGKRKRKYYSPDMRCDFVLEEVSCKTKLTIVVYIDNVNSLIFRILLYIHFGIFGYFESKRDIRKLVDLIERYV